jgi:hypothetical protein
MTFPLSFFILFLIHSMGSLLGEICLVPRGSSSGGYVLHGWLPGPVWQVSAAANSLPAFALRSFLNDREVTTG